jgi:hypothetical protein
MFPVWNEGSKTFEECVTYAFPAATALLVLTLLVLTRTYPTYAGIC